MTIYIWIYIVIAFVVSVIASVNVTADTVLVRGCLATIFGIVWIITVPIWLIGKLGCIITKAIYDYKHREIWK
jgi:hypothetical protein